MAGSMDDDRRQSKRPAIQFDVKPKGTSTPSSPGFGIVHILQHRQQSDPPRPGRRLASVSARACSVDHLTLWKISDGSAGRRRAPDQPVTAIARRTEDERMPFQHPERLPRYGGREYPECRCRSPPPDPAASPAAGGASVVSSARPGLRHPGREASRRAAARAGGPDPVSPPPRSSTGGRGQAAAAAPEAPPAGNGWRPRRRSGLPAAACPGPAGVRARRSRGDVAMSIDHRPLSVQPPDHGRCHSHQVKRQTAQIAQWTPDIAVSPVAFRRCGHGQGKTAQPASADPSDKCDILHQLDRGKPADRLVEVSMDQQALIAIGQTKPAASPCDHRFKAAGGGGGIVER